MVDKLCKMPISQRLYEKCETFKINLSLRLYNTYLNCSKQCKSCNHYALTKNNNIAFSYFVIFLLKHFVLYPVVGSFIL